MVECAYWHAVGEKSDGKREIRIERVRSEARGVQEGWLTRVPAASKARMAMRWLPVRTPRDDVSSRQAAPRGTSHWASARPKPPSPPVMM